MESATRRLRQQRAFLTAQQGDAQLPASGTLLARRNRLRAELERADDERAIAREQDGQQVAMMIFAARAPAAIQRDIHRVEEEIENVKRKIASIDQVIADEEAGHVAISK